MMYTQCPLLPYIPKRRLGIIKVSTAKPILTPECFVETEYAPLGVEVEVEVEDADVEEEVEVEVEVFFGGSPVTVALG